MDLGDDDTAVSGFQGFVDNQQIAVMDAHPDHGIALYAQEEGGLGARDEMLVQRQAAFHIIVGR